MGKKAGSIPKVLNQKAAVALLKSHGWEQSHGGKHQVKMEKEGHRPITLPQHKGRDYPAGLRDAILKQAGLKGDGADADS